VLPTNFPSTKISAASGSEVMVIWPEPSGEGVAVGGETVDSELAGDTEAGGAAVSWESGRWPDNSVVVAGGTERAG